MDSNGTCSICYEKLNENKTGVQCAKCGKKYHSTCHKQDGSSGSDSMNSIFVCQPCSERRKILCLLENQREEINNLPTLVAKEVNLRIAEVKEEIKNEVESVKSSVSDVRHKSSFLYTNYYESNILISGIPITFSKSRDLLQVVIEIGSHYNVHISTSDIYFCRWIKIGKMQKSVLVQFINLFIKEDLMKKYMASKNLKTSHIPTIGQISEDNRIFINYQLAPDVNALMLYCRKLLKMKRIKKFFVDFKEATAKVTCLDDSITIFKSWGDLKQHLPINN